MTRRKHHEVEHLVVSRGVLTALVDGTLLLADLGALSPLLEEAADEDLKRFEVLPSGYGIHRPSVDEYVSIDGLLRIEHQPPHWQKSA
jgi:hypothetical protein